MNQTPTQNNAQNQNSNNAQTQAQNEKPKSTDRDYSYTNLDIKNIIGNSPKPISFDTAQGKISYNDIPLNYNYGTEDNRIIEEFYLEGPVVECRGILTKEEAKSGTKGRPDYIKVTNSMMFIFNLQDPDCVAFIKRNSDVHSGCCHILSANGGKVGLFDFDPTRPGGMFKNPMYFKRDTVTGQIVEGRNPSMFAQLNNYNTNKTLFTDPMGNIIDWKILKDVELKLIPLFHYEKIYVASSGKSSMKVKLVSAIIVDLKRINSETKQGASSTLEKYLNANQGLGDMVTSQIAQLTMESQDALDQVPIPTNGTARLPSDSQMHNMSQQDASSLNDFLGGAPGMNQGFQQAQANQQMQNQGPNQAQAPPVQSFSVPAQNVKPNIQSNFGAPLTNTSQPNLNIPNGSIKPPVQLHVTQPGQNPLSSGIQSININ